MNERPLFYCIVAPGQLLPGSCCCWTIFLLCTYATGHGTLSGMPHFYCRLLDLDMLPVGSILCSQPWVLTCTCTVAMTYSMPKSYRTPIGTGGLMMLVLQRSLASRAAEIPSINVLMLKRILSDRRQPGMIALRRSLTSNILAEKYLLHMTVLRLQHHHHRSHTVYPASSNWTHE